MLSVCPGKWTLPALTQKGALLKKSYSADIRCSDSSKILSVWRNNGHLLGECVRRLDLPNGDDESDVEGDHIPATLQHALQSVKDLLDARLPLAPSGNRPFREIRDFLIEHFGNRQFTVAAYGQKCSLSSLSNDLEELSTNFFVDIAIAVEISQDGQFVSATKTNFSRSSYFPFLSNPKMVNLQQKGVSRMPTIPGAYYHTTYQTMQHEKKRIPYLLEFTVPEDQPANALPEMRQNLKPTILRTMSSVRDFLLPKVESSACRTEVYVHKSPRSNMSSIQESVQEYIKNQIHFVQAPTNQISDYIKTKLSVLASCMRLLENGSFSAVYTILRVYADFIVELFCLQRCTQAYLNLIERKTSTFQYIDFLESELKADYLVSLSLDDIFKHLQFVIPNKRSSPNLIAINLYVLLVTELGERNLVNFVPQSRLEFAATALEKLRSAFRVKEKDSDEHASDLVPTVRSVTMDILLLKYQSNSGNHFMRAIASNLLQLSEINPQLYASITHLLKDHKLSIKIRREQFVYDPKPGNIPHCEVLQFIQTTRYEDFYTLYVQSLEGYDGLNSRQQAIMASVAKTIDICYRMAKHKALQGNPGNFPPLDRDAAIRCFYTVTFIDDKFILLYELFGESGEFEEFVVICNMYFYLHHQDGENLTAADKKRIAKIRENSKPKSLPTQTIVMGALLAQTGIFVCNYTQFAGPLPKRVHIKGVYAQGNRKCLLQIPHINSLPTTATEAIPSIQETLDYLTEFVGDYWVTPIPTIPNNAPISSDNAPIPSNNASINDEGNDVQMGHDDPFDDEVMHMLDTPESLQDATPQPIAQESMPLAEEQVMHMLDTPQSPQIATPQTLMQESLPEELMDEGSIDSETEPDSGHMDESIFWDRVQANRMLRPHYQDLKDCQISFDQFNKASSKEIAEALSFYLQVNDLIATSLAIVLQKIATQ